MDLGELECLIDLCLKKGVIAITLGEIGIDFGTRKEEPQVFGLSEPMIPSSGERLPSDDEMLLYSTESFDEIRNERKKAILPPNQEKSS